MKPCPFCGENVEAKYPHFDYLQSVKKYTFSHFCEHPKSVAIAVTLYGDTAEEVIELWNRRCGDEQEHPSK